MAGITTNKKFLRQASLRRPPVEKGRWASKGTKPLPEQATIKNIICVMIIHICRKVLFIETRVKITLYSLSLFFGSLVFDFLPMPRTYLSYKDNAFNLYFVKIGWAWLLSVVGSFVYLTSATYGCGKTAIIQQHMARLVVGTLVWGLLTQWLFASIESATGTCLGKSIIPDKWTCITSGFQWHAFDISGHAFILVYMNLVTVEEAQAIVGWETIREMLFHEEHHRKSDSPAGAATGGYYSNAGAGSSSAPAPTGGSSSSTASGASYDSYAGSGSYSASNNGTDTWSSSTAYSSRNATLNQDAHEEKKDTVALRSLSNSDFFIFKSNYEDYTPYIRALFICMTCLSIACDVLLACTIMYFHTMPQKVVGGFLGIAAWYFTYKVLFRGQWPGLPGEGGLVRYHPLREKLRETHVCRKKSTVITKDNQAVPMFMGMPMYGAVKKEDSRAGKETAGGGGGGEDVDEKGAGAAGDSSRPSAGGGGKRSRLPSGTWR